LLVVGFDPFFETQKGLAELLNDEILQQQQQQQQTSKILENVQRTRMPPPGFNHMNAFGFGVPRAQGIIGVRRTDAFIRNCDAYQLKVNDISGSKILPFMNLGNSNAPQQQTNWGQQQPQQQQQHLGYPQNEQGHAQPQNGINKSGW
jgi:CCR4-NOT transcription complex subunit 4